MARSWIARYGRSSALASAGFAFLMGLAGSLAMAQELAWPPSTPDGEPHIDHTRKVLNCSEGGCRLTVVHSQEELLQAITVPDLQIVSGGISEEQAAEIQQRIQYSQQQLRVRFGMTLVLGSCFGGDLPWQNGGTSPTAVLPPEMAQHFREIEGTPPAVAKTSK